MTAEADEPRKRRKYTTVERQAILKTAAKVGPVEAARHHGVPQTTVSNWLHRDATKVAKEEEAQEVGERAAQSKPTRTRAHRAASSKVPMGSMTMPATKVESTAKVSPTEPTEPTEPTTAAKGTKAARVEAAQPTTMLPKRGIPLPDRLVKRVAR